MKHIITLFTSILLFNSFLSAQLITILEARGMNEGDTVNVTGTVSNGEELGTIRYFQDATAGIAAYDFDFSSALRHDSITLTGVLVDYNGLLEITPVISYTIHGQADNNIIPEIVTADELGESTEGTLVQVDNVVFGDGGSVFNGGSTYNYTADGEDGVIYIRSGHPIIGEIIPVAAVTLIGISSQFSFTGFGGYQIIPRDIDDIINDSPINIVSSIEQTNLSTTGFTVSWITDGSSSTGIYYGTDEHAVIGDMDVIFNEESVTEHSIELTGLTHGSVYFVRTFSILGGDTALSNMTAFATVSLSSGEMVVLFNFPVNHSVASSSENLAIYTSQIDDSVASWIDKSMISLDIAMYNTNRPVIEAAINAAYSRGVQIRYIAEGGNANIGLDFLNLNIPVLERQNAISSGMHNKFMIIDADSTENAWVMGGSTNFSSNMIDDPNNLIFILDQSLARSYRVEFDEMWGSNGAQPNASNSRFGEEKNNNTPHKFIINGDDVELYFSPSDGTSAKIVETILSANSSVHFSLLVFTRDEIGDAIIQMNDDFFVTASGIIEQTNVTGSEYQNLLDNGVNVLDYGSQAGLLHHKLAIIDHDMTDSDPIVLTGSHNWSSSAENTNDENILIIHNADIANLYYQEYSARYNELTVGIDELGEDIHLVLYPNPAKDNITIIPSDFSGNIELIVYDISGKIVKQEHLITTLGEEYKVDINELRSGLYYLKINTQTGQTTLKFIKN